MSKKSSYATQAYWRQRSDAIYYQYVDYIMRSVAQDAQSLIDVGSGNCPYLDWFDWIPERVSVDIRVPYQSDGVRGIQGDIHELSFEHTFDICTCLQVLEHVPDAKAFSRRLQELGKLLIVSVPYNWSKRAKVPGHVHDPVDYKKLTEWMGREANYRYVVEEPFGGVTGKRLIALYDRDPERVFNSELRKKRLIR